MSQPADPDAPNAHEDPEAEHTYDANIEVLPNGAVRAQLVELIGCYAIADDVTAALAAVAERIPAYYEWLRAHDDYTPVIHGPFRAAAKEIQRVTGNTADLDNAFFATDAEAVSAEDLDWLLALLDWSLDDLLRCGERIDPAARDVPTRVGPPANMLLRQAAQTQARYLSLLNAAPDPTSVTRRDATRRRSTNCARCATSACNGCATSPTRIANGSSR